MGWVIPIIFRHDTNVVYLFAARCKIYSVLMLTLLVLLLLLLLVLLLLLLLEVLTDFNLLRSPCQQYHYSTVTASSSYKAKCKASNYGVNLLGCVFIALPHQVV